MAVVPRRQDLGAERELPALGMGQFCYEMSQPSSLVLLGAYKAQMYSNVWTNTKKHFFPFFFFFTKERHGFPAFQ